MAVTAVLVKRLGLVMSLTPSKFSAVTNHYVTRPFQCHGSSVAASSWQICGSFYPTLEAEWVSMCGHLQAIVSKKVRYSLKPSQAGICDVQMNRGCHFCHQVNGHLGIVFVEQKSGTDTCKKYIPRTLLALDWEMPFLSSQHPGGYESVENLWWPSMLLIVGELQFNIVTEPDNCCYNISEVPVYSVKYTLLSLNGTWMDQENLSLLTGFLFNER